VLFQIDLRPDVPLADLAARREATTA
jgi:hypothetical protein